ncbi:MAG: hypothetical protein CMJ78_17100 [Planctomycetaceae bacterium]|nr:hypothetical protein [Planctomycetaceae bacterium]
MISLRWKRFLRFASLCLIIGLSAAICAAESQRPNVIILLADDLGSKAELWHKCYNSNLNTSEWKRLRNSLVLLNTFQESWIPLIKSGSGGFRKFELYDLSTDPNQKRDISGECPEVVERLKRSLLAINSSVLSEGVFWSRQPTQVAAGPRPAPKQKLSAEDAKLDKLLTAIDQTKLSKAYNGKFEVLATNRLDDEFNTSPAIAGAQMFLRGRKSLYCIDSNVTKKTTQSGKPSIEEKTKMHRLSTTRRSAYDAFAYVNRLPAKLYDEESSADHVGRIFGRLANQEGRILLKAPPGMD